MSTLPPEDLKDGFEHLNENHIFDDDAAKSFKEYFLKYIPEYWIEGCYPQEFG